MCTSTVYVGDGTQMKKTIEYTVWWQAFQMICILAFSTLTAMKRPTSENCLLPLFFVVWIYRFFQPIVARKLITFELYSNTNWILVKSKLGGKRIKKINPKSNRKKIKAFMVEFFFHIALMTTIASCWKILLIEIGN